MRLWLLRIAIGLLVLAVLLAMLWGVSRLRGATSEQRAAMATFEQMPAPEGSNAFPAVWLLQWDVPQAEQEAVAAEDAQRFRALPAHDDPRRGAAVHDFRSVAADRFEDLAAGLAPEPASCGWSGGGCLERVRADRHAHAARLEQVARLVDRVEAVADYDHYRSVLPYSYDMPFPRLQLMSLARTRHALQFVDGDADAALAGSCRALGGWRRLAGDADSVLVAMYAAAGIEGYGSLLADMLAELPSDHALPAACGPALAPLREGELGLCRAMRGEWELGKGAFDVMNPESGWIGRVSQSLVLDRDATAALYAWNLAWPCGEEAERARAEDRPMHPPAQGGSLWRFECVANAMGCILMDIARPAYADYGQRMQDAAARIRLLHALEGLRARSGDGDGRSARALLADLSNEPGSPGRAVEVDPDGMRLRIEMFNTRRDTHWHIPLPPDLQDRAVAQ